MTARGGRAGFIRWRGASVTLTYETTANNESSDAVTVTQASVAGYMVRTEGEGEQLAQFDLTELEAAFFEFVPATTGEPVVGALFEFAGETFAVKQRWPVTMNGTVGAWRVLGVRG
jgi:hypothetical protein